MDKSIDLERNIAEICEKLLYPDGQIFELKIHNTGKSLRVLLILDKTSTNNGSYSSDELSEFSREISSVLEEKGLLSEVSLEVSTPGIERTLRNIDDYIRFCGHLVKIIYTEITIDPEKGKENIREKTDIFENLGVDGNKVQLKKYRSKSSRKSKKTDETIELEISKIKKGNLYVDY